MWVYQCPEPSNMYTLRSSSHTEILFFSLLRISLIAAGGRQLDLKWIDNDNNINNNNKIPAHSEFVFKYLANTNMVRQLFSKTAAHSQKQSEQETHTHISLSWYNISYTLWFPFSLSLSLVESFTKQMVGINIHHIFGYGLTHKHTHTHAK